MMNKTKVDLGTVQETLLIPLWARAVEASQEDPILKDTKSVEIVEQIDYDFSKLDKAKSSQAGVCSMSPLMMKNQKHHDVMKHYAAKFQWGIKDIRDLKLWDSRYKILEINQFHDMPSKYLHRMGLINSLIFRIPPFNNMYRLSLAKLGESQAISATPL